LKVAVKTGNIGDPAIIKPTDLTHFDELFAFSTKHNCLKQDRTLIAALTMFMITGTALKTFIPVQRTLARAVMLVDGDPTCAGWVETFHLVGFLR
jgi:hypothetical protein